MFNNVIIDVFYNGDSELWSPQESHPYSFNVEKLQGIILGQNLTSPSRSFT